MELAGCSDMIYFRNKQSQYPGELQSLCFLAFANTESHAFVVVSGWLLAFSMGYLSY